MAACQFISFISYMKLLQTKNGTREQPQSSSPKSLSHSSPAYPQAVFIKWLFFGENRLYGCLHAFKSGLPGMI